MASESAPAQTGPVARRGRGCRTANEGDSTDQGNGVETPAAEGESPVPEGQDAAPRRHLSKAGHEKSCPNPRGPSRKAKHYRETDSEPVP